MPDPTAPTPGHIPIPPPPGSALAVAFARIERLACNLLDVDIATIRFGPAAADDADANAGAPAFHAETPLFTRDGAAIGALRVQHPTPRPALTEAQRGVLADLAATAMDALDLQREVAARQQRIERLALRERLLKIVADAPSFAIAIETVMAELRDATHSMLCLFFRLGPDGTHLHLVAGQASSPELTQAYLDHLRQIDVRTDNSLVGAAVATGEQQVVADIDHTALRRYPAIGLSVANRIAAQIVTPVSIGAERYSFSVGLAPGAHDIAAAAEMLLDLAGTLRPLLRRLRDSEETALFRRVVEASNDSVIISEPAIATTAGPAEPRIRYVNAAFTRQTGYPAEEVIGRPYSMLHCPTDAAEAAAALAAGRPFRRDVEIRRRDGSHFWADSTMAPILAPLASPADALTHWVAIERDITERKLAQESVALNEQRFRLVARATSDVVWDWDLAAGTIWWSEGMQSRFGYPADAVRPELGWWVDRLHPEDRERVAQGLQAVVSGAVPQWRDKYRFRKADGDIALITDRGFVIRDAAGQPIRMVGSMLDITHQQQLEEQLRQSQRLDAIGRLTGGIAHDFNNLLSVIIGNAEIMKPMAAHDPALLNAVELIFAAAERGAGLTGRLLTFARRTPLNPQATEVNTLLAQMEQLVRRVIGADIEIVFLPAEGGAPAVIDAPQLENAILNLCINARDAMPQGGRLTIQASTVSRTPPNAPEKLARPYIAIAVTDTGTGMPPEVVSRAFEPFFTTKAFGEGSGLGLSMVFGFVSQSDGQVDIASEPGRGTCVTLYLPRATAPAAIPSPKAAAPTPAPAGHGKILLVEDNPALRQVAAAQLGRLGYQVLPSADGQRALEIIRATDDIDLLFTDMVMPGGLSGQQLAEQALALRPGLRVLFTSGYPDTPEPESSVPSPSPPANLLRKPYRLADLAAAVRAALNPPPA